MSFLFALCFFLCLVFCVGFVLFFLRASLLRLVFPCASVALMFQFPSLDRLCLSGSSVTTFISSPFPSPFESLSSFPSALLASWSFLSPCSFSLLPNIYSHFDFYALLRSRLVITLYFYFHAHHFFRLHAQFESAS